MYINMHLKILFASTILKVYKPNDYSVEELKVIIIQLMKDYLNYKLICKEITKTTYDDYNNNKRQGLSNFTTNCFTILPEILPIYNKYILADFCILAGDIDSLVYLTIQII